MCESCPLTQTRAHSPQVVVPIISALHYITCLLCVCVCPCVTTLCVRACVLVYAALCDVSDRWAGGAKVRFSLFITRQPSHCHTSGWLAALQPPPPPHISTPPAAMRDDTITDRATCCSLLHSPQQSLGLGRVPALCRGAPPVLITVLTPPCQDTTDISK